LEVTRASLLVVTSAVMLAALDSSAQGLRPPQTPPQASKPASTDGETAGPDAQQHLLAGIALTRAGQFSEAIPHFLAAQGRVADSFALDFNLALCYVATRQFPAAIRILVPIRGAGKHAADRDSLLAQAYIGDHQEAAALKALQDAVGLAPSDEKLYLLLSEACLDEGLYDTGTRAIEIGLENLPNAPRLLFERALLRSRMEQLDLAAEDFQQVERAAPGSDIAYIAAAQQALLSGRIPEAIRVTRQAIEAGNSHYLLLTMLGEALLRSGVTPSNARDFSEARSALERAVQLRPTYSGAHISLAKVYLLEGRVDDAITHLETARQLDSRNRAIYPALAAAYQRAGQPAKAKEALEVLSELNRSDIERIRSAPGGHAGYVGSGGRQNLPN